MPNISVDNLDQVKLYLRQELAILSTKLQKSMSETNGSKAHAEDIARLKSMQEVMMSLVKLYESIFSRIELNPIVNVHPEFTVPDINIPEIKIPDIIMPEVRFPEMPIPQVHVSPADVSIDIEALLDALEPLRLLSSDPYSPISVRLSDGRKFVEALQAIKDSTDKMGVVYAGQSGMTIDEYKTAAGRPGTDFIWNGSVKLTPKFTAISASTGGNNTIVAAVATKKIRVLQAFLVSAGSVNTRFESGADGTALTGQMNLVANTGYSLAFSPVGLFETAASTLLNPELSAGVSVDGSLVYIEV